MEKSPVQAIDTALIKSIQEVKSGKTNSYTYIVTSFEKKIQRYISKMIYDRDDVSDIVQNVFIKAYINIASFDESQKFSPWIFRIAHNESLNFIKKKKSIPFSFFEPDTLLPYWSVPSTTHQEIDNLFQKKEIETIIQKLKHTEQEILHLFYYEEMSYKEISRTLEIPTTTVGVRLNRAKAKLQELLATSPHI